MKTSHCHNETYREEYNVKPGEGKKVSEGWVTGERERR